jgi:hypothetical protein
VESGLRITYLILKNGNQNDRDLSLAEVVSYGMMMIPMELLQHLGVHFHGW